MAIVFTPVDQGGGKPLSIEYPVAASQTITKGMAVTQTGDQVRVASNSDDQILGIAGGNVTTDGTITRGEKVLVYVGGDNIFKGIGTGAPFVVLSAHLGDAMDLDTAETSGQHKLLIGGTTEDVFQIVELPLTDEKNGTYADYVHFRIIRSTFGQSLAAKA